MPKKKIKNQIDQFRQGDVLVDRTKLKRIPPNAGRVAKDAGRTVLAYGEVTGHAHAISSTRATLWEDGDGARYLEVKRTVSVMHEEHSHIGIPPGIYKVTRQREYRPGALPSYVAD